MSSETEFHDPLADDQFWFNTMNGEVEKGRQSPSPYRLGPFNTPEEAANAPEVLKQRSQAWAEEEEREENWGSAAADTQ